MREGLRRELLTQKVIEQEVGSKIAVTDQDVTDFFIANRAQFNVAEESYHIAQIVVTPVRDAQAGEPHRRRCGDAAGGNGEGADADGASEERRVVRRARDRGTPKTPSRRRAAAIWGWCRCRGSSRRRRRCATPC